MPARGVHLGVQQAARRCHAQPHGHGTLPALHLCETRVVRVPREHQGDRLPVTGNEVGERRAWRCGLSGEWGRRWLGCRSRRSVHFRYRCRYRCRDPFLLDATRGGRRGGFAPTGDQRHGLVPPALRLDALRGERRRRPDALWRRPNGRGRCELAQGHLKWRRRRQQQNPRRGNRKRHRDPVSDERSDDRNAETVLGGPGDDDGVVAHAEAIDFVGYAWTFGKISRSARDAVPVGALRTRHGAARFA